MIHPISRPGTAASIAENGLSAEALELADYLAGQDPLDAEAAVWAARRQDGLSAEEEAELQAWLAGDPTRGARLDQLTGVLGQLDQLPPDDVAALKESLPPEPMQVHPEKDAQPRPDMRPGRGHCRTRPHTNELQDSGRRRWLAGLGRLLPQAAMAGMAALAVGGGWMSWNHWQQQPSFMQSFFTPRGQQLSATLPEGSTMRLDTATRLEVALYRHQRVVHMPQGQALFEVKPDTARPFHVVAGRMRITVLGTRFSVRHTPSGLEAGGVSVVVEEGRVQVTRVTRSGDADGPDIDLSASEGESIEVTAGQRLVADAQGRLATVTSKPAADASAWRDGRVVLNDTPLGNAVAEFERYVDTGLVITDPRVAALRLNGSFDVRRASAFKSALPQALPVRLHLHADGSTEVLLAD